MRPTRSPRRLARTPENRWLKPQNVRRADDRLVLKFLACHRRQFKPEQEGIWQASRHEVLLRNAPTCRIGRSRGELREVQRVVTKLGGLRKTDHIGVIETVVLDLDEL